MANVFDYIFNIGGNYSATINGMSAATGEFLAKVNGAQSSIGKLTTMLAAVDLVKNAIDGLSQATESLSVSGVQLNSQMHDLSAVAGVKVKGSSSPGRTFCMAYSGRAGRAMWRSAPRHADGRRPRNCLCRGIVPFRTVPHRRRGCSRWRCA